MTSAAVHGIPLVQDALARLWQVPQAYPMRVCVRVGEDEEGGRGGGEEQKDGREGAGSA